MGRSKTPSYTITLRLETTDKNEHMLNKTMRVACHIQNVVISHANKCLHRLLRDKKYCNLRNQYQSLTKEEKYRLTQILNQYGLSEYQFHSYVKIQQKMYKHLIDANTAQKIASRVWIAVADFLFDDGEMLHFKKARFYKSFEGKSNSSGIRYRDGNIEFMKLILPVHVRNKDSFVRQNLDKSKIKYCRILRKWHKHKYRYYVQLVMECYPIHDEKRYVGNETIGIDIGPSSIAVVTDTDVLFEPLASNVDNTEREIAILNRKIDRQRRANNPNNYNDDGTYKEGHHQWKISKTMRQTMDQRKALYQKRHNQLEYSHNLLANKILSYGTDITIEDMNWSALAKRSKQTKRNKKGKYQSKKRFGRSIANHAPSMLMQILNIKLGYYGKQLVKVDTFKTKASQFNFTDCTFTKHELKQRWIPVGNDLIQRDLLAAFNLKHVVPYKEDNETKYTYAIDDMKKAYPKFKNLHDALIWSMQSTNQKYPYCMGI